MRTLTLILIVIQSQSMFDRKIDVTQGFFSVNYTQRKINSTHLLNISKKSSQKYLLLELFSQSQSIMLLQSFDEAPYILNNKIYCDNIDEDGKYFALKYHHIILEQENKQIVTTYITILTNQTTSYRFSITAFEEMPCPNNCSNNGDCIGICRCQPNFTDIDCSQKGFQISPFLKDSQQLDLQKPNFFYTTINSSKNYLLKVKWESDQPANSSFQIRISKIGKLPCNSLNNYNINLSSNKLLNLTFKGNQIQQSLDLELMLIVKLEVQDAIKLNTLLNFEIVEKEFPDENEKIYRIGILIIFFLFVVITIYLIIKCCFNQSNNRKWKFIHYNQIISVEECVICLDNFSENEQMVQLNCSHIFHFKCVELWIEINQTCPICKLNVIV